MYQQSCNYGILSILSIMAAGILMRDKQLLYSSIDEQESAVLFGLGLTDKEIRIMKIIRGWYVILVVPVITTITTLTRKQM